MLSKSDWKTYIREHNFELNDSEKIQLGRQYTFALRRVFIDLFSNEPSAFYMRRAEKKIAKIRDAASPNPLWVQTQVAQIKAEPIQTQQVKTASKTLIESISTRPLNFASLLLPMFEPVANGSSELLANEGIRKNLERLFTGHEEAFEQKIKYPLGLFQWLLETQQKKDPEYSLGTNVKKTGLEVLREARSVATYLQTNAKDIESKIQSGQEFDIPDVNPDLKKYLQGLLSKIYAFKMDKSKGLPPILQQAIQFKGILSKMLYIPGAQWAIKKTIMSYILPVFNNPPLSKDEQRALNNVVESALKIGIEQGFVQRVFDFLSVAADYKTMSVEELIQKSMPHMIGFINIFDNNVISQWQLDPAINEIMASA